MKATKQDWWIPVGVFEIIVGVYGFIVRVTQDMILGGVLIGGIQIIVGLALLKKSILVFWLGFIISIVNTLQVLGAVSKSAGATTAGQQLLGLLLVFLRLGLYFMLWRQIKEKKLS